jgi:hypothetical protein
MKHLVKEMNGVKYIEYNDEKNIMENKQNLMIYTTLEKGNIKESGIKFPFYYTKDYNFITINKNQSVLEQIYDYLNFLYFKYSICEYIIVKLYFDVIYEVVELNIYPVITKNSILGDKIRMKCENLFDYLNICMLDVPSDTNFKRELRYYSVRDKRFIELIPYLNCGIFKYDENGKVNRFLGWDTQGLFIPSEEEKERLEKIQRDLLFDEIEDDSEYDEDFNNDEEEEIDF